MPDLVYTYPCPSLGLACLPEKIYPPGFPDTLRVRPINGGPLATLVSKTVGVFVGSFPIYSCRSAISKVEPLEHFFVGTTGVRRAFGHFQLKFLRQPQYLAAYNDIANRRVEIVEMARGTLSSLARSHAIRTLCCCPLPAERIPSDTDVMGSKYMKI